ncbi:hypothetical protein CEQ90_00105 [Lewinellaceae bacterium SD302]|nr:hypothetical protein CEQ90_00105 [Lewinellaceae bacterium SD302]
MIEQVVEKRCLCDMKKTYLGGAIAAIIILSGNYFIGRINEVDAIQLINASQPTIRFMCSAIMTATATILALLLTVLSFSSSTDQQVKSNHYERILIIARISTGTFIAAMIGLLLLSIPFVEADKGEVEPYFKWIYYFMQVYAALLAGSLITIVFMLYDTAKTVIMLAHPDMDDSDFTQGGLEEE